MNFRVCQCLSRQSSVPLSSHRRSRQMARRRRTNRMLIIVTINFFVSWAPLNLFNITVDIIELFYDSESSSKTMLTIFAFCHLIAMTSVVTNSVMYGFLNDNFRKSLISLFSPRWKSLFGTRNTAVINHQVRFVRGNVGDSANINLNINNTGVASIWDWSSHLK